MLSLLLLCAAAVFYAGYNLLIKQSSIHAELTGVTTITAVMTLQLTAFLVSLLYLLVLRATGVESFALPAPAYWWALLAGLCIGAAEVCYFYIFSGSQYTSPVAVSVATPVILGGTVVLATVAAFLFFGEKPDLRQWAGAGLILAGIVVLAGR